MFCAFGADDAGIPIENVDKFESVLKTTNRNAVVKTYEGAPHSFFNDTRDSYRPAAAKDAWERSLALFQRVLK
jgi:carboxymethylenebutenolidase